MSNDFSLCASAPLRENFSHRLTAALCWCLVLSPATAAEPTIRAVNDRADQPVAVEVGGLSAADLAVLPKTTDEEQWQRYLSVWVKNPDGRVEGPAISGRYELVGDKLRFTPRYPFVPGVSYTARFLLHPDSPSSAGALMLQFAIPRVPPAQPTRVLAVYPSAAVLPENQLRFYIHFSAPMRQGEAYSHVRLLGPRGTPDKRAFLEIGEELWDPSGQRLTLLFDPGRVKQGLRPREEFGPVLEAGKQYTLLIDDAWHDAAGQPLAAGYEKKFTAGPPVETAIDPGQWKIAPPQAATRQPLVVRFPRPLDRALLEWTITVLGPGDQRITGDVSVRDEERRWEFRPDQPWTGGQHSLLVDTTLEDTAGNNLSRPFEVDVFREIDKGPTTQYVRIPFLVAP